MADLMVDRCGARMRAVTALTVLTGGRHGQAVLLLPFRSPVLCLRIDHPQGLGKYRAARAT